MPTLYLGDCLDVLRSLPDNSVDSVVTDPPYFLLNQSGKGFMGKEWDSLSIERVVAESIFKSMKLVLNMDEESFVLLNANKTTLQKEDDYSESAQFVSNQSKEQLAKRNLETSFVQELVITKAEALVLCQELFQTLTKHVAKLPSHARFVTKNLFTQTKAPRSTVHQIVSIWLDVPEWQERLITFTSTGNQKKQSEAIEETIGTTPENKFMNGTIGRARDVTQNVQNVEKSNATTLYPLEFRKIIQKIISSPYAKHVIQQFTKTQNVMGIISASFHEKWASECLRVLKPGGHMLAFSGTRTYHQMATGIENAGFEIRDQIQWIYGSGFPKSLNISKAIDKEAGAEREVIGISENTRDRSAHVVNAMNKIPNQPITITAPATDLAKQWDGWGTALKPSNEPICLARKPLSESTVAKNVVKWGTGGINVDDTRIPAKQMASWEKEKNLSHLSVNPAKNQAKQEIQATKESSVLDHVGLQRIENHLGITAGNISNAVTGCSAEISTENTSGNSSMFTSGSNTMALQCQKGMKSITSMESVTTTELKTFSSSQNQITQDSITLENTKDPAHGLGRWPSNTLFDEEAAEMLDEQSGVTKSPSSYQRNTRGTNVGVYNNGMGEPSGKLSLNFGDSGGASRFFMVIKNECGLEKTEADVTSVGKKTENKSASLNIDGCGNNITDPYLMTIISITKTATHSTITFLILNAFTKMPTGICIIENENGTSLLTESNIVSVSFADNTSCLVNFRNEAQELIKATAKIVSAKNLLTGENGIENIGMRTIENIAASRFAYVAKASRRERNAGLDGYERVLLPSELCKEENTVLVALLQKVTSELTVKWNIAECGEAISAIYPKECKSIIEMEISRIIESKILNSLLLLLTNESTQGVNLEMGCGLSHVENVKNLKAWILTITYQKMDVAHGVVNAALKMLLSINKNAKPLENFHSTVKPIKLMEYLCKLITPPGGTIIDPFMGSGSTGIAARNLQFDFIGIEREEEYFEIAKRRINGNSAT